MKIIKKDCAKNLSNNALVMYLVTELKKQYKVKKEQYKVRKEETVAGFRKEGILRDYYFEKDGVVAFVINTFSIEKPYNVQTIRILNQDTFTIQRNDIIVGFSNQDNGDIVDFYGDGFVKMPEEVQTILLNKFYNMEDEE